MISIALTPEEKLNAGIYELCNTISLAGAFITLNGYEPPKSWLIDHEASILLPTVNITDFGYEHFKEAEIFLLGWKHQLYCSYATFWCEVCGKENKDCDCRLVKVPW